MDFAEAPFIGEDGRLPTSIHGLSPYSRFLQAPPSSPSHSIVGEADGVAPLSSAHLDSALSEILVPTGHGGSAHSSAIEEIKRILMPAAANRKPVDTPEPLRPDATQGGIPTKRLVLRFPDLSGLSQHSDATANR